MSQYAVLRRERGRRRVSQLTRAVAVLAAVGSLGLSAAAARTFPGKSATTPASHRVGTGHAQARGDDQVTPSQGQGSSPSTTTNQQQAAPPVSTSSPPVTVSGGS
jgi:hypothetical protein